jgi:hypothetical protein
MAQISELWHSGSCRRSNWSGPESHLSATVEINSIALTQAMQHVASKARGVCESIHHAEQPTIAPCADPASKHRFVMPPGTIDPFDPCASRDIRDVRVVRSKINSEGRSRP